MIEFLLVQQFYDVRW